MIVKNNFKKKKLLEIITQKRSWFLSSPRMKGFVFRNSREIEGKSSLFTQKMDFENSVQAEIKGAS